MTEKTIKYVSAVSFLQPQSCWSYEQMGSSKNRKKRFNREENRFDFTKFVVSKKNPIPKKEVRNRG